MSSHAINFFMHKSNLNRFSNFHVRVASGSMNNIFRYLAWYSCNLQLVIILCSLLHVIFFQLGRRTIKMVIHYNVQLGAFTLYRLYIAANCGNYLVHY
jgi:hypothetical protein